MIERHIRGMGQRPERETLGEIAQHVFRHGVKAVQRRRIQFEPDQFHQFGIGMHDAFDPVSDAGSVGGEKTGVEPSHTAGRRDGAGDQEQT